MAADPSYPLYAGDFLAKMALCTIDEIGAYQKIRCYLWINKIIPKERLGFFLGSGWEEAWKNISKFFSENENGEIFDPEIEVLREERLKFKEKQAINGCKGGRPTLDKTQNKPKYIPSITQNKPKPNPKKSLLEIEIENENEIEDEIKKEKEKEKKEKLIFPFESSEFLKLWETWKNYKKTEFNFTYKSIQSEQAALMEVYNLSGSDEPTATKIILQSMSNKWKGFFEIKNLNNYANNNATKTNSEAGNNAFERANIAVNEYFGK